MNKEEFELKLQQFLNNQVYIMAYRFDYNSARIFNDELIKYIKQLLQENKQLKEELSVMVKDDEKNQETIIKLGKKISKAIEYLKSYNVDFARCEFGEAPISMRELDELLKILKGKDNE